VNLRKLVTGSIRENADGNDTVLISVLHVGRYMRSTECCRSSWLLVEFSVLKWSGA